MIGLGVMSMSENTTAVSIQLYTQDDAAALLGLSVRTLEGWRYKGQGPAYVKIGGRVRYRHQDLDAWLDAQTRDLEPFASAGGCK